MGRDGQPIINVRFKTIKCTKIGFKIYSHWSPSASNRPSLDVHSAYLFDILRNPPLRTSLVRIMIVGRFSRNKHIVDVDEMSSQQPLDSHPSWLQSVLCCLLLIASCWPVAWCYQGLQPAIYLLVNHVEPQLVPSVYSRGSPAGPEVFMYDTGSGWLPSDIYTWPDMIQADRWHMEVDGWWWCGALLLFTMV